jgi:adenosine kinase
MGNPLLDISATVKTELLEKYNLKANDAILYEKEDLFEEIQKDYTVDYIAGGATQNTIRVAQWIFGEKAATAAYFGCVGADACAETLRQCARSAGVDAHYEVNADQPTGRCAVLITGHDRSLVTKLDAANHYTIEHLNGQENWAIVERAKVFYSAGFFLTVSVESMIKVAKHAANSGKIYCMNLSAPFLCEFFKGQMMSVLPYTNVIFGNETEAAAFGASHGYATSDVREIAQRIAQLPMAHTDAPKRMVVITQGALPVVVVEDGQVAEYETLKLSADEIVDTNGAGDAFVGGFLAQLVSGKPTATCVRCGIWAATEIIKRSGCTYPEELKFA